MGRHHKSHHHKPHHRGYHKPYRKKLNILKYLFWIAIIVILLFVLGGKFLIIDLNNCNGNRYMPSTERFNIKSNNDCAEVCKTACNPYHPYPNVHTQRYCGSIYIAEKEICDCRCKEISK